MTDPTPPQPARTIPVRTAPPVPPARSGKPAPVTGPWRPSMLMVAPHRLAFWLAMLILVVASGWWLLVQEDRVHGWFGLGYAVSPTLTHAAAMVFGFMPLFFAGFLFTAGPKWLRVEPLPVPRLQCRHHLRHVGAGVFDVLCLVQHHQMPLQLQPALTVALQQ